MPALRLSYADRFGTPHPEARCEISRMHVELGPDGWQADFQLVLYHDAATKTAGALPFEERPMQPLTDTELAQLAGQFAIAVYQVLLQRAEFAGATLVP